MILGYELINLLSELNYIVLFSLADVSMHFLNIMSVKKKKINNLVSQPVRSRSDFPARANRYSQYNDSDQKEINEILIRMFDIIMALKLDDQSRLITGPRPTR